MRIVAFAAFPAWPAAHGGAVRVAELTTGLVRRGHRLELISLSPAGQADSEHGGVQQHVVVPAVAPPGNTASRFDIDCARGGPGLREARMVAAEAAADADAVLCFQIYCMPMLEGVRCPIVLDMMDVESEVKAHAFPGDVELRETVRRIEVSALAAANRFLATTRADGEALERISGNPTAPWSLCPNATMPAVPFRPPRDARREAQKALGLPTDLPVALFFSSGHPPNVVVAREIAFGLAPRCPDVRFLIAGSVSWGLRDRPLPTNVSLIFDIPLADRGRICAAADAGLNPVEEQLPASDLKVLDYMAWGIPVAATERGVRGHDLVPGLHYYPMDADPCGAVWKVAWEEDLGGHLAHHALAYLRDRTWDHSAGAAEMALAAASAERTRRAAIPGDTSSQESLREYYAGSELVWSAPAEIALDLTNDCHLRCTHCYRTYSDNVATYLRPAILERIPDRFYVAARQIELSGMGEPMLHPQWNEILEYLAARTTGTISFNTSLTIWDEARLRRMVELGTAPSISIDAARPETFERIRKRARHERVFGGLRRLLEIARELPDTGFHPRAQWTLYRDNLAELHEFVDMAAELGLRDIRVQPLAPHRPEMVGWTCEATDPMTEKWLAEALRKAQRHGLSLTLYETLLVTPALRALQADVYSRAPGLRGRLPIHDNPSPRGCSFPWTQLNVDSAGWVVACCFSDFRLGNLNEQELDAIWNNEHFQRLRREVNQPRLCRYCVDSPSGGVCCPRIQHLRTTPDRTHWLQSREVVHAE